MQIVILCIIAVICFAATTVFRHISDSRTLISVAIGAAINANIFNSVSMPIVFGSMTFGIDSILYTLFIFNVIIKAKDYSIKDAKDLTISTIIAILVSAFIELFAKWSFTGINVQTFISFLSYFLSSLGTFIGIWVMLRCFKYFEAKKVNIYVTFFIVIVIESLISSSVYFCGSSIVKGDFSHIFSPALEGSYIGKLFSIVLGLLGYYVNKNILKPGEYFAKKKI